MIKHAEIYKQNIQGEIAMKNKEEILKLLYKIKAEQDKRRA